jgi:hypothetical protein
MNKPERISEHNSQAARRHPDKLSVDRRVLLGSTSSPAKQLSSGGVNALCFEVARGRRALGTIHLLTSHVPKPRLATGGIRALMVPLGQLGHEAKAASSGRTPVGGDSGR